MEADGLIVRKEKHNFPLEVYYSISEKGRALGPALSALETWANEHAIIEVEILRNKKS
jgi:DNA-binding HxlR family transcriptional regulator